MQEAVHAKSKWIPACRTTPSISSTVRANPIQLALGVSPRGTLMLQRAAQARAFLDGRDFCLPDDFKTACCVGLCASRRRQRAPRVASAQIGNDGNRVARNRRFRPYSAVNSRGSSIHRRATLGESRSACGPRVFPFDGALKCRARSCALLWRRGRTWQRAPRRTCALLALAVAAWVAVTLVPTLAKRTPLRWIGYKDGVQDHSRRLDLHSRHVARRSRCAQHR